MKRLLIAGAGALALAATGVAVAAQADAATLTSNWYASAPYLMPFDNSPPDAVQVMNATGQKAFQLAFILAPNSGGCSPTWDGTRSVAGDTEAASLISRIRAAGGGEAGEQRRHEDLTPHEHPLLLTNLIVS